MNAKAQLDLYRLQSSEKIKQLNPMIVGIDVVNKDRLSVVGFAATNSRFQTQHQTELIYKDLYKDRGKDRAYIYNQETAGGYAHCR